MGYTHYWRTKPGALDLNTFLQFERDSLLVIRRAQDLGVFVAGGDGTGEPFVTNNEIVFNGVKACGHAENSDVVIPRPSAMASGVGNSSESVAGVWTAGVTLDARTCDGDCHYETCEIVRVPDVRKGEKEAFEFCKTAYRPYDLVVTAVLLLYAHHFPGKVRLSSDGERVNWIEGQHLVWMACGFTPEIPIT